MTAVPQSIEVPSSARRQSWSRSRSSGQTTPRGSRQRSATALGIASKTCSWPVFLLLVALIVPWEFCRAAASVTLSLCFIGNVPAVSFYVGHRQSGADKTS